MRLCTSSSQKTCGGRPPGIYLHGNNYTRSIGAPCKVFQSLLEHCQSIYEIASQEICLVIDVYLRNKLNFYYEIQYNIA